MARGRFAGKKLYVESGRSAGKTATLWRTSRPADAKCMDALAEVPLARWIGDWTPDPWGTVNDLVTRAGDALSVLVCYNIPLRDLHSYSAGGASSPTVYRRWIDQVAFAINKLKSTIVVLEPDALSMIDQMSPADQTVRAELLTYAVDKLTAYGAFVYIDAGSNNWIPGPEMGRRLLSVGVQRCAGFATNTSGTQFNKDECAYAKVIKAVTGPVGNVIDTSRNGLGQYEAQPGDIDFYEIEWLNSPGRGNGRRPDLNLAQIRNPGLDALLWVKTPGDSDGADKRGHPAAGIFQPEEALALYKRAVPKFPPVVL